MTGVVVLLLLSVFFSGGRSNVYFSLFLSSRLQRLNAVHYWLPCTLKYVPDSYQFLLGQLERSMRHSEELSHSWCHLHAKLVTVRAARSLQVISTQHLVRGYVI